MMEYVAVLLKKIVILFVLLFSVQFQGCECEMYECIFVCMPEPFKFSCVHLHWILRTRHVQHIPMDIIATHIFFYFDLLIEF